MPNFAEARNNLPRNRYNKDGIKILRVYTDIESYIGSVENPILTTGTFDGVHVGHQKIIQRINEIARKSDGESVLLTFFPHPRTVIHPEDHGLKLLNTQREKIDRLEKAGLDHLVIYPFTKEFSRLSYIEYVRDILVNQLGVHKLVIGYDHHFGKNREGSFEDLQELAPLYDFTVEEISAQQIEDVKVSSTKIRKALSTGDIKTASKFLSYHYPLTGRVVQGEKVGRELDFPTANLKVIDELKLIPCNGVYAVTVIHNETEYNGMLNIGTRPTIAGEVEGGKPQIEVNIFNFDQDIYDELLTVNFVERIRGEEKFNGLEALKAQLLKDKERSLEILK